jgi:hypothetical protein
MKVIKKIKLLFSFGSLLSLLTLVWHILNWIDSTKKYINEWPDWSLLVIKILIISFLLAQATILFMIFKLSLSSQTLKNAIVLKNSGRRYKPFHWYALLCTLLYLSAFALNVTLLFIHNAHAEKISKALTGITIANFILLLSAKKIIDVVNKRIN